MTTTDLQQFKAAHNTHKARLVFKHWRAFRRFFGMLEGGAAANPLMQPLYHLNGIVFPYSPNVIWDYSARYSGIEPMHSNFAYTAYQGTSLNPITLSFTLVSDTQGAARYNLAAFHFLRSVMKMHQVGSPDFGDIDNPGAIASNGEEDRAGTLAGTPPPVLNFSSGGDYMLNKVPVVVENLATTSTNEKQMVSVAFETATEGAFIGSNGETANEAFDPAGSGAVRREASHTRIPLDMELTVTLRPAYNPRVVRESFDTRKYAGGYKSQFSTWGFQ